MPDWRGFPTTCQNRALLLPTSSSWWKPPRHEWVARPPRGSALQGLCLRDSQRPEWCLSQDESPVNSWWVNESELLVSMAQCPSLTLDCRLGCGPGVITASELS